MVALQFHEKQSRPGIPEAAFFIEAEVSTCLTRGRNGRGS